MCTSIWTHATNPNSGATVSPSAIHVDGSGVVNLVPDQAHLTLGFSLQGDDTRVMERKLSRQVGDLVSALNDFGVVASDISTSNIRIQPRYRYDQERQQQIEQGFVVERSIALTLRDLKLLGAIIQLATEHRVSSVSPPRLSSSNYERAYQEALAKAFELAKRRAQRLASAAGLTLGQARVVNASKSHQAPMPGATRTVMAMAENTAGYDPGELSVSAVVTVEFQAIP